MSTEQMAINEAAGKALAEANLQTQPQWIQDLAHGNQALADKVRPLVALGIAGGLRGGGASEFVDLASASRRTHILEVHRYGGEAGNSWFPHSWSDGKIVHEVSDIGTDPSLSWVHQTGSFGADFTRAGDPVKYRVEGVRDGLKIRVIIQPGGEGIVIGFPIP